MSPVPTAVQNCFEKPSTKSMVRALGRWGVGPREYALLIVNELSDNLALSARNVERLEVNAASALRVYDVLRADKIIIETSALRYIQVCWLPLLCQCWHFRWAVRLPGCAMLPAPRFGQ